MTIQALEQSLPNGFHDAILHGYEIDLRKRRALFRLEICIHDPDSGSIETEESWRLGTLALSNLEYFSVEAPNNEHIAKLPDYIDLCDALPGYPVAKNEVKFRARFYWSYTNSFIHLAADDAEFTYTESLDVD